MTDEDYIKLVKKVQKLKAKVKEQDKLIDLLTDELIKSHRKVDELKKELYGK